MNWLMLMRLIHGMILKACDEVCGKKKGKKETIDIHGGGMKR